MASAKRTLARLLRAPAIAALVLAALPGRAHAQVDRGELRLSVSDRTGLPIAASGTLSSEAPQLRRAFIVDASGRFVLLDLPFGVYRLVVEMPGFTPYSSLVEVRSAVPRTLSIQLEVSPFETSVDATIDTAPLVDPSRAGVTFSIGAPQIQEALPAVPGRRMLELVDAQPGWLMEANGVLHPRGSEYQTLFVIDGVPMDENRSPAFAPDLQDSELQGMSVLTGNFPAEYGRKLGGIVEVTTIRDIEQGWHAMVDAGGGSFNTASGGGSVRYGWSRRALSLSASAATTDRYLDPPVPENDTNHGSLAGISAAYDDELSDASRLRVTLHHRTSRFLVPNERVQQAAGQRQERTGREDLVQGTWTTLFRSRLVFSARGMAERIAATLDSNASSTPIVVSQDRSLTRAYGNASLAMDLGRHQVKFGGDVVVAPVREALAYTIPESSRPDTDAAPSFRFSDRRTDREQSAFAQDTMRVGDVTVSAGLRWDNYRFLVDDWAFSPRLGVAWAARDNLVLRASYDRAFQTPAVENLLLASSSQTDAVTDHATSRLPVDPSRGNFLDAGVTIGLTPRLRADVTAYRRAISQFADDDVFLNTGVSFPVAFSEALIRGVDAKVTLLSAGRMSGFASYSLLKGTARLPLVGGLFLGEQTISDLLESDAVVPITQDQRHTIRGQVRLAATDRLWVQAMVRYGSGLPVELEGEVDEATLIEQFGSSTVEQIDFERGRVRPNVGIDAGAGYTLLRRGAQRLTLRVEAANLTNRTNVINFAGLFSGTALGAPRSATVRVQFQF